MLSIVLPTFNELKSNLLKEILDRITSLDKTEVIVVDSNSTDGTKELIRMYPKIKLISGEFSSRAERMNAGIKAASSSMILLHHPRSLISSKGLVFLRDNTEKFTWGAFTHKFDKKHSLLTFTSWYSNFMRGDVRSIYYLDHCIFAKKSLLSKIGFVPEVPIFEDTELSLALRSKCKGIRLPFISKTSAIRFEKNGIIKQIVLNQILKFKFYFKSDFEKMNKRYEREISLNNDYTDKTP